MKKRAIKLFLFSFYMLGTLMWFGIIITGVEAVQIQVLLFGWNAINQTVYALVCFFITAVAMLGAALDLVFD